MSTAAIEARKVSLEYFNAKTGIRVRALSDIDLTINRSEFLVIVGPSGCGKTTFLNAVAGLLPITSGELLLSGQEVSGPGPDRAVVFQTAALLPWRTVEDNVRYGLEILHADPRETDERVKQLIGLLGLKGFEQSFPYEISGGMQQRVNVARALAVDPDILLMDEPLAALDALTREFMQQELLRVWSVAKKTVLFITHDISEAVFLADRVIVFSNRPGRVHSVVDINIPRPRELLMKQTDQFTKYAREVWEGIEVVSRAQFAESTQPEGSADEDAVSLSNPT